MGNVSSRPDEGTALYLRDQTRCKYTHSARGEDEADKDARTVTISRRRTVLNVVPNAFPATRVSATRDLGDNSVVEFVQV
jgi:Arf-GAP/SH3 domain/ANK repeat/PH domain-containing protein